MLIQTSQTHSHSQNHGMERQNSPVCSPTAVVWKREMDIVTTTSLTLCYTCITSVKTEKLSDKGAISIVGYLTACV